MDKVEKFKELLQELEYTGDWELDKKRFSSAWKKNQEVFDLSGWDKIDDNEDEYGDF